MQGLLKWACLSTLSGSLIASLSAFAGQPESVPGEYIVKLKESASVSSNDEESLRNILGSQIKSTIPDHNLVVVWRPIIEVESSVLASLQSNPMVEYAEPNFIYRINKTPNDPMLGQLWGLINTGAADAAGSRGTPGIDIGAEQAWDIETGSKDVVIAVIDTGVLYTHPDLKANMWVNSAEASGKTGVDDDGNGVVDDIYGFNAINSTGDPKDDHGHGSHCSGTIGAHGDDGAGLVGVNWNVRIMAVKFLSAQGSGSTEGAIRAIDYATKMGARIMSNSWGGGGFSQALKESITKAHEKGILFVAAAGNESNNNDTNPTYPATYDVPNVLAVAAIDNQGQIASFSNYGKKTVQVGAPGVKILSSTTEGYQAWSGTSMATPHVAGIAGLLAAHFPDMKALEIKNRIISTAKPVSGLRNKVSSNGIAHAYSALTNTQPGPDPNDPSLWASVPVSYETAHPYKARESQVFNVEVPNAKEFSLYFEKFETEAGYDILTIEDSNGKVIAKLSGSNSDSYSVVIPGNSAKLSFKSDDSVNSFGFKITKAAFR